MLMEETIPIQLAAVAIFIFSLALGFLLLRLRDIIFGSDVGIGTVDHRIDFNKKIAEEEQMNLDLLLKGQKCEVIDTASIVKRNWEKDFSAKGQVK